MLVFPLLYLLSFLYACRELSANRPAGVFVFFIAGLPLYITTLSVLHLQGLDAAIPFFQYAKELLVLVTLAWVIWRLPTTPAWNGLDRLMLAFFLYTALYIFLPLGGFRLFEKVVAFKNISFFPLLYFMGRWISSQEVWVEKLQKIIMLLSLAAAGVLMMELIMDTHLQQYTGYASFYDKYFAFDPAGNYGLSWTFEIEGGIKRFASFFANPLEHAASTLITLAVLLALYTSGTYRSEPWFFYVVCAAIGVSILLALSRASLAGFILVSYLFFWITRKKKVILVYHVVAILLVAGGVLTFFNNTISDFILASFNFADSSSLSHVVEWITGIEAITDSPLGMGLGESGRVAGAMGLNTGGENQLIILGVQCGIPAMALYLLILIVSIIMSVRLFRQGSGKAKQLGLMVFVIRIGLLIPLLTAAVESYLYVSYVGWLLTGLMSSAWSALHQAEPVSLKGLQAK